jgi:hypothetical protein
VVPGGTEIGCAIHMLLSNQSRRVGRHLWSHTRVFELIALLLEAIFSWPMVPTDWPPEHRRLVHVLYLCLLLAVLALGLLKLA